MKVPWPRRTPFGVHHRRSALGFYTSHYDLGVGIAITCAITVRHIIETVLSRHRTDAHRFKKYVVAWISCHSRPETSLRLLCKTSRKAGFPTLFRFVQDNGSENRRRQIRFQQTALVWQPNDPVCNFDYLHILTVTFNCPIIGVNFRLLEVAGSNHLDLRPLGFEDMHHSIWQSHYI